MDCLTTERIREEDVVDHLILDINNNDEFEQSKKILADHYISRIEITGFPGEFSECRACEFSERLKNIINSVREKHVTIILDFSNLSTMITWEELAPILGCLVKNNINPELKIMARLQSCLKYKFGIAKFH